MEFAQTRLSNLAPLNMLKVLCLWSSRTSLAVRSIFILIMQPSCLFRSTLEAATKILECVVSMRGGLHAGSTCNFCFQSLWSTTTGSLLPSLWSVVILFMSEEPISIYSEVPMPSARSINYQSIETYLLCGAHLFCLSQFAFEFSDPYHFSKKSRYWLSRHHRTQKHHVAIQPASSGLSYPRKSAPIWINCTHLVLMQDL